MKTGVRQPPIRAYMDDLTVTTTSVMGSRWILRSLEKLIAWARMKFKPAKSRSFVMRKGGTADKFRFSIAGTMIPTLSECPVKSLGKIFDTTLRDTNTVRTAVGDLELWLTRVDKSGLPGRFKAWIYQNAVLPRILWPLFVYDSPMTIVEAMERKIHNYLRRWLGFPRSLGTAALYGSSNALQLPFKGLMEEFVVSRTREVMLYRDSKDPKVATAGIEVRTGKKWCAKKELGNAEERLRLKALVGTVAIGRAGLGYFPSIQIHKAKGKQRRNLIQEEVRASVEEKRRSKMVGLCRQGAWTRLENFVKRKISWANIWHADASQLKFLAQSVYDVLPSPANLFTWGKSGIPSCPLCAGKDTLRHIMSACPRALSDGRYRWRHDLVLRTVADTVDAAIRANNYKPEARPIYFVQAGESPPSACKINSCLLSTTQDWQWRVDIGNCLKVPEQIATTTLRPDLILWSTETKQVLLIELTVPWEENIEVASERKLEKYQELVEQCKVNKWWTASYPIEVGCRGFAGRSICRVLSRLGMIGEKTRKAIRAISESAEKASRWLWIKRAEPWSTTD